MRIYWQRRLKGQKSELPLTISTITYPLSCIMYKVQAPQEMKLCIHSLKGFQVVDLKDVLFCEASGSYTNFYFADKHFVCTAKTILEYEELLEDAGFVRIHKSFLVNLLHVKEYLRGEGGSVILSNGKEIEVARRKKDIFINKMKEYYKY
ncbi:MAG: LytTR family transcriptional regulator [Bacteroidetes bacterium]|nr:MAG: LytTR family transcriptional regulator [Bacteroidota bacterium]